MNTKKYCVTMKNGILAYRQPLQTKGEVALYLRQVVRGLKPDTEQCVIIRRNK